MAHDRPVRRSDGGAVESGVQSRPEFVGRQLDELAAVSALVDDDPRHPQHGDHTCHPEELRPPHDHLR